MYSSLERITGTAMHQHFRNYLILKVTFCITTFSQIILIYLKCFKDPYFFIQRDNYLRSDLYRPRKSSISFNHSLCCIDLIGY